MPIDNIDAAFNTLLDEMKAKDSFEEQMALLPGLEKLIGSAEKLKLVIDSFPAHVTVGQKAAFIERFFTNPANPKTFTAEDFYALSSEPRTGAGMGHR